eukprot:1162053-Pelagomonas_calceolata.AAC.11
MKGVTGLQYFRKQPNTIQQTCLPLRTRERMCQASPSPSKHPSTILAYSPQDLLLDCRRVVLQNVLVSRSFTDSHKRAEKQGSIEYSPSVLKEVWESTLATLTARASCRFKPSSSSHKRRFVAIKQSNSSQKRRFAAIKLSNSSQKRRFAAIKQSNSSQNCCNQAEQQLTEEALCCNQAEQQLTEERFAART